MRRRGATLLVGALLLAVLVLLAWQVKVPYVELGPGPTWDTLGKDKGKDVIQVSGTKTSGSAGQLRMVTVGVTDHITLWEAMRGWLNDSDAVVPREVIYPPNQTQQQVDQENQQDFKNSQTSAETAALRELGYPVQVAVQQVSAGLPADGRLKVGDVITSVDGKPVTSAQRLTQLIRAKPAGSALAVGYTRAGASGTTTLSSPKGAIQDHNLAQRRGRPQCRPDVQPGHRRQGQGRGPHRRVGHRGYRHHRRRRQRRRDRGHRPEDARRQAGWGHSLSGTGGQLRRGRQQRGTPPAAGQDQHAGQRPDRPADAPPTRHSDTVRRRVTLGSQEKAVG
jgi:membrane-associated protease RseP (regulator of RpoE activity)